KELSFFGSLRETERRREVSKLLGMETIRDAQKDIAEQRKRAEGSAKHYRMEYLRLSEGRDFPTEIANAKVVISEAEGDLNRAEQQEALRHREVEQVNQRVDQVISLQTQDQELRQQIGTIDGEIRTAEER